MSITETTIFDEFERTGLISDLKCIYLGRWNVFYTHIDHTYQVGRPGDTRKAPNWHSDNIVAMCNPGMERAALEGGLGRGSYVVGAQWDEGNMVHAMRRFGGTTVVWRFGDG